MKNFLFREINWSLEMPKIFKLEETAIHSGKLEKATYTLLHAYGTNGNMVLVIIFALPIVPFLLGLLHIKLSTFIICATPLVFQFISIALYNKKHYYLASIFPILLTTLLVIPIAVVLYLLITH